MAVKTFTTNELLTSSDTNTYLANSGLVYVKSQTIGTTVSSVAVSSAFSATYENYKIIISGGAASTNVDLRLTLTGSTANYLSGIIFVPYSQTTVGNASGIASGYGSYFPYTGNGGSNGLFMNIDLMRPYETSVTGMSGADIIVNTSGSVGWTSGYHNVAASYTGFTITPSSGTLTGGTITVYGYRKA